MRLITRLIVAGLSVFLFVSLMTTAFAQEPGSGLSISPLHHRLTLDPGQASKVDITLKNITSGPILAKAYVNDFTSDNSTGNPVIITDPEKKSPNSIRNFVVGLENVSLEKGEQKKFSVPIQVPKDVSPGAYYGIIRYQALPRSGEPINDGQVSLSASVGTIVLIQVKGDLVEKLQLLGLRAYRGDDDGTFFFRKPDKASVRLKNMGNSFAEPFGRVTLTNMSGKEIYSYELNNVTPRSTVLPGSEREFKNDLKNVSSPGRYTLSASVSYGNGSDVLVSQKTFWYIPTWLAAVLAAVLVALLLATIMAYRRYHHSRKRNKKLHHRR